MSPVTYNPQHKLALDALLLDHPEVRAGVMFGYPAYYVGRKLFACVIDDAVGVKVPEALAKSLLEKPHITPFQPLGRPKMREWVQLNRVRSEDYEQDQDIFAASIQHVKKSL